jgi:tetratricopeptide (TPR) repeat protein
MAPVPLAAAASPIEAEVLRIRGLMQASRHDEALAAAQALIARVPENRDVLYMIAVTQRYLGRLADALDTLARLEALHPGYSRLFQERGHCHIARREPGPALEAYLQAVNINPALPASWEALRVLFRACGQMADSENAAGHVAKLKTLAPAVITATSLFSDGEVYAAEEMIRPHLKANPTDVEAMRLLARIGVKLDILDDAEFLLESVLEFSPNYQAARYDYVRVLLQRHRNAAARHEAKILVRADPRNRDFRAVYASACVGVGEYEEGVATYRDLLREAPHAPDLHLSVGHALKTLGRQQEAITAYWSAAKANPHVGDAYWSLANLKTYRFAEADIARMRAIEAQADVALADRYHLCFALGKALEDRGEYADSFAYYARGNALKKDELKYRPETTERNARLQMSVFTPELMAARRGVGCERPDPIFIVGLPRAGSTLLEQILASHSQVEGTMELADITRLVVQLHGRVYDETKPLYPENLRDLPAEKLRDFGEKYLADTQIYRSGKPFFIDKNPNNFRHLGLIHLILPNAKIIDARREPMACCFSNFKQLFASGQEFTYGLEDIGRYYRSYVALMAHWDAVLPGKILRVQHEDVVDDLEGSVRRILAFCGLAFEPACLAFHKTARSVRTASSEQVRQPIFRDGLDQWQNFDPWLNDLRRALSGEQTK